MGSMASGVAPGGFNGARNDCGSKLGVQEATVALANADLAVGNGFGSMLERMI
jgi:UTP-glucose-1-phosphate uridylyltransferase